MRKSVISDGLKLLFYLLFIYFYVSIIFGRDDLMNVKDSARDFAIKTHMG